MFSDELEKRCRDVVAKGGRSVVLIRNDGRTMLCGNRGPRGELLSTDANGQTIVSYKAKAVLMFLTREKKKTAALRAAVNQVLE